MTADKARKRAIRERMAATGEPYTEAARAIDTKTGATQPPGVFASGPAEEPISWAAVIERLDRAETGLKDRDPRARAAASAARAKVYDALFAHTTDPVYAAACARAALLDDETAAEIRFLNGIPSLYPRTEAQLLRLNTCDWCGRPWQANPDGACPHCPRLLFGPTLTNFNTEAGEPGETGEVGWPRRSATGNSSAT